MTDGDLVQIYPTKFKKLKLTGSTVAAIMFTIFFKAETQKHAGLKKAPVCSKTRKS